MPLDGRDEELALRLLAQAGLDNNDVESKLQLGELAPADDQTMPWELIESEDDQTEGHHGAHPGLRCRTGHASNPQVRRRTPTAATATATSMEPWEAATTATMLNNGYSSTDLRGIVSDESPVARQIEQTTSQTNHQTPLERFDEDDEDNEDDDLARRISLEAMASAAVNRLKADVHVTDAETVWTDSCTEVEDEGCP